MNRTQKLVLVIVPTLLALWLLREPLVIAWTWISDRDAMIALAKSTGAWGPSIIASLLILQTFLAIIPGQALMVACGYLYGFAGGTLLAWASLVIGGQAAFLLARRFGRSFAERWVSKDVLTRWDKAAEKQGVGFFAISLILPIFPNDAMCYVAGLGTISARRFLLASMLGRGVTCALTAYIGAYGSETSPVVWAVGVSLFLLATLAWKFCQSPASIRFCKGDGHVSA